jgi:hypothetical protein
MKVLVDDRHARAGADCHAGGVGADDASSDDHDLGRRNARHASQQHTAALGVFFEVLRAELDRQAARHFAHRNQQRQSACLVADGFVGNRGDFGIEQLLRQFGQRRQMQVGEEHQPRAKERELGCLRLLHLQHERRALPHFGCICDNLGARGAVVVVMKRRACARTGFDQHRHVVGA